MKSFLRIEHCKEVTNLTIEELGMFMFLTRYVREENNFVFGRGGYLSIQEISRYARLSRHVTTNILHNLQEKGILVIVNLGNKNVVYLKSKYVWYGLERNRNDSALEKLLAERNSGNEIYN